MKQWGIGALMLLTLMTVEARVKQDNIELSNERMADMISEETGAMQRLLHACHNISKRDFDQGGTYLELMNQNVTNLREALH